MLVPNRNASFDNSDYRYGFQGQERDDELKGSGNSINYTFRMHDPRVGRFFSVDPLEKMYAWNSPYSFSANRVIRNIEAEGLETADPMAEEFNRPAIELANFTGNSLISGYNAVGNAMLWTLEVFWSDETEAKHIKTILRKSGVFVSNDISASQLADMFTLNKNYKNVEVGFEKDFWGQAANAGIGMIDIIGVLSPFSSGGGVAMLAKTPLTVSPGSFLRSSEGLLYGFGSKHGTRLAHVLDHTVDNLGKKIHGIFTTNNIIGTIDEAWSTVKSIDSKSWNSKLPVGQSETINGVTRSLREVDGQVYESFTVDLKRVIGKEGGKLGSGQNLSKLIISVKQNTSEVITAFPTK